MERLRYYEGVEFARQMDELDPLAHMRSQFCLPRLNDGEAIYLCGNSLGPAPKKVGEYLLAEFADWSGMAVEGHWAARRPWLNYHELVTESLARLVGAEPIEVVAMNTLSVNLNLMMISFYRPTTTRCKILIEGTAFPSDRYAVDQQCRLHGLDPATTVLELHPRIGESTLRTEDIVATIEREGDSIALILIGNVNYLTGQCFDIKAITAAGHARGCKVGFDLAHAVGNVPLNLHDDGPDFAVWCHYKYVNAGPGAIAGCFVHKRHANEFDLVRLAGWWGHNKATRFEMGPQFQPIQGAEGWQLSNPGIFQLAALRAALEMFDAVGMDAIREKSLKLTGYLEFLLDRLPGGNFEIVTPRDPSQRGAHLSLAMLSPNPEAILEHWKEAGIICDFRHPNIIRVAPAPLFNTFMDVHNFVEILKILASSPSSAWVEKQSA
jgi:kynureninase